MAISVYYKCIYIYIYGSWQRWKYITKAEKQTCNTEFKKTKHMHFSY